RHRPGLRLRGVPRLPVGGGAALPARAARVRRRGPV
ncbi:MAG: hypothetical protein AVDCRST_MAG88-4515, partial [uncultured Thermomicrobiales bacterium]